MENLGLDIKLLLAQIVNFVILFFVLKKLVYKPFIKLIDERNKKISDSLDNTKQIEETLKSLEEKEAKILEKARDRAKQEREDILKLAESEKENVLEEARMAAKREIEKGLESIKSAEDEAVKNLTDEFIDKLTAKLQSKISTNVKGEKYPVLKKLTK